MRRRTLPNPYGFSAEVMAFLRRHEAEGLKATPLALKALAKELQREGRGSRSIPPRKPMAKASLEEKQRKMRQRGQRWPVQRRAEAAVTLQPLAPKRVSYEEAMARKNF